MKLLAKFNLIFILVMALGVAVSGWISHGLLQAQAREEVVGTGRLMMEKALAVRGYTTNHIANGMLSLMRLPGEMQRLRDDPTLAAAAAQGLCFGLNHATAAARRAFSGSAGGAFSMCDGLAALQAAAARGLQWPKSATSLRSLVATQTGELLRLLAEGAIGQVRSVQASFGFMLPNPAGNAWPLGQPPLLG